MRFDPRRMKAGQEYRIHELPGADPSKPKVLLHEFSAQVFAAMRADTIRARVLHIPTGKRYLTLEDVPAVYGPRNAQTGMSDISIVFIRNSWPRKLYYRGLRMVGRSPYGGREEPEQENE